MLHQKTSSSSLIDLASQLYSPEDRHQYTQVILKKEQMMAQIEMIRSSLQKHYQQCQLEQQQQQQQQQQKQIQQVKEKEVGQLLSPPVRRKPRSIPTNPAMRHSMSSYSMLLSKSASMYQPKLLEHDHPNSFSLKQIDKLLNQYNNLNTIEQLLVKNVSSSSSPSSSIRSTQSNKSSLIGYSSTTTIPALKVETTNLSNYHQFPLSPPLSPPTSSIHLSTSSSASTKSDYHSSFRTLSLIRNPIPPSSTCSSRIPEVTIDTKKISIDLPSTPIASPTLPIMQQYHTLSSSTDNNQTPCYNPTITHIQKNNGMRLRSFLGQSVVLNKMIRMEQQRVSSDSRFYQGKDETSGQAKVILKLVIIKSPASSKKGADAMAPFGIHFENSAILGGSTANMTLHAWIPDSLVLEALAVWLVESHLPHLLNACQVMRDGIKLYIIYNASEIY